MAEKRELVLVRNFENELERKRYVGLVVLFSLRCVSVTVHVDQLKLTILLSKCLADGGMLF